MSDRFTKLRDMSSLLFLTVEQLGMVRLIFRENHPDTSFDQLKVVQQRLAAVPKEVSFVNIFTDGFHQLYFNWISQN